MSVAELFLLGVLAAWGAIIDAGDHPDLACAMIVQAMSLRSAVVLEPDSISRFLVR